MQKIFENGNPQDNRKILVNVTNDYIEFYFHDQYKNKLDWIRTETEKRIEYGEEPLGKDELSHSNFYWFFKSDFELDLETETGWVSHMRDKIWFTKEMENFINQSIK